MLANSVVIEVLSVIWVCYDLHYASGCFLGVCDCCLVGDLVLLLWFCLFDGLLVAVMVGLGCCCLDF